MSPACAKPRRHVQPITSTRFLTRQPPDDLDQKILKVRLTRDECDVDALLDKQSLVHIIKVEKLTEDNYRSDVRDRRFNGFLERVRRGRGFVTVFHLTDEGQ